MGKLRDSLTNATKLVAGVEKGLTRCMNQINGLGKDTDAWVKSGFSGLDEFCLYILEKLKKKNIEFKTVENDLIKNYMDSNVGNYLQALQFLITTASDCRAKYDAAVDDQALDNDLAALDKALGDVAEQIRKKKKKLLQSKKYKAKIAGYETTLGGLQGTVKELTINLKNLRSQRPPSANKIRQLLGITENSKLKDLILSLSGSKKELHKEYNSLVLNLNQTASEMREHTEFAGHMKVIKEMLNEAEEMDKE
jgi:hypothetical protein